MLCDIPKKKLHIVIGIDMRERERNGYRHEREREKKKRDRDRKRGSYRKRDGQINKHICRQTDR